MLLLVVTVLACWMAAPVRAQTAAAPQEAAPYLKALDHRLFLIGDAGNPAPEGDPVLAALENELRGGAPATVVFLGDNIYERGLTPEIASDRLEMERRIQAQIDAVVRGGADGVFIPGNHDWDDGGRDGWAAVRRQEAFVERNRAPQVRWLPDGGCPGPVVVPLGNYVQLVVLDTQWWLHGHDRPTPLECTPGTEQEVMTALQRVLAQSGKLSIVVGHHPLKSGGPHGGHFTWEDHIFPLREAASWAWLPLPVIGSLYPLSRMGGMISQDQSSEEYQHLIAALNRVLSRKQHLLYAAGHEHALEVLDDPVAGLLLISGGGYYGHTDPTGDREETLFTRRASGYMRLDVSQLGEVRLAVIAVNERGETEEIYAMRLAP